MWLLDCCNLYPDLTQLRTGRRYRLEVVEEQVWEIGSGRSINADVLRKVESSEGWSYPDWWPRYSESFKIPIELDNLHTFQGRQQAVTELYKRLKNIEVVSVVLRFLCPAEFGILSPPVSNILNLPPSKSHVKTYHSYLASLHELLRAYPRIQQIARVDMGLWSAAHLDILPARFSSRVNELKNEMSADDCFQQIRLKNLFAGIGNNWRNTTKERLILSRSLLPHDSVIAGVVAAKCFEDMVVELGKKMNLPTANRADHQSTSSAYINLLRGDSRWKNVDWVGLRSKRNLTTHETASERDIEDLIQASEMILRALDRASTSSRSEVWQRIRIA